MSTNKNLSAEALRHRKLLRRQRRILYSIYYSVIIIIVLSNFFYKKEIQAINHEVHRLNVYATELACENQVLSAALQQSNRKLALFVDNTTVRAAEPTYYNIPLSNDIQLYTYTRCVEYGIPEHYELVLAIMWQESNYTADIISSSGDYGIMQINICNHEWLSDTLGTTDFLDVYQNIDAGTYIISKLLIKYGDEHKALMAYNIGESGASIYWNAGIYTNTYSRDVVAKRNIIMANNYNAE